MKDAITIEILAGVEGRCLVVNDTRVAGPKPWGGGSVIKRFSVDRNRLEKAIYQNRPKTVCLCGSSKFPAHHMQVMMDETLKGNIVIPMGLYGHADFPAGAKSATNDGDESTEVKQMLDRLHFSKIDLADEILVVNVDGYIGNSTKREIEYAQSKGKVVRYFETVKEESCQN